MLDYEHALQQLSQAPLAQFVAERKRLAAELRAQGDAAGAAKLTKRAKPVTSVWVTNQLYWHARDAFDALLAAAERLRAGERDANAAYHGAIATLRRRAAAMLREAGHAESEPTLRRVAITLAAIAAAGGFAPDPPGALSADRDPPGFESVNVGAHQPVGGRSHADGTAAAKRHVKAEHERGEAHRRAAEEKERQQRLAAERARKATERGRIQTALRAAQTQLHTRERERTALERRLRETESAVSAARDEIDRLERQLAALDAAD